MGVEEVVVIVVVEGQSRPSWCSISSTNGIRSASVVVTSAAATTLLINRVHCSEFTK